MSSSFTPNRHPTIPLGSQAGPSAVRRVAVCLGLCAGLLSSLLVSPVAQARKAEAPDEPVVAVAALPAEGQKTYKLILAGGPFPYSKDGVIFGNRERILPSKKRGYYREYTVKTPGARDRGARRIVCGGAKPVEPDLCYYTADHYSSFSRIVP